MEIPRSLKKEIPEAVLRKIETMDELNQQAFLAEFKKRTKSPFVASVLLFALPCFHYFYVGKIWVNLIFWGTAGGCGIWWLIDCFRIRSLVREYNRTMAIHTLRDIQILN